MSIKIRFRSKYYKNINKYAPQIKLKYLNKYLE